MKELTCFQKYILASQYQLLWFYGFEVNRKWLTNFDIGLVDIYSLYRFINSDLYRFINSDLIQLIKYWALKISKLK